MMSVLCVQMAHGGFYEGFVCHSCCVRQVMQLSYVSSFWSAISPVVRVLGTARRDRMYAENLVIECEVCLTFNGNNLHEYIQGAHSPWQASHPVLKGNTTEFQM